MVSRKELRSKRKARIRAKVNGTEVRPRLCVYRSNTRLSVQGIDDVSHVTLFSSWVKGKNAASAKALAATILEKLAEKKVTSVVFDRAGFRYHGVLKIFADAIREGGIKV